MVNGSRQAWSVSEFPAGPQLEPDRPAKTRATCDDNGDWPAYRWPGKPLRAREASKIELLKLRVLIVLGTVSLMAVLAWLLGADRVGDPLFYLGLTAAVLLRATSRLFEWYNYWSIKLPPILPARAGWTVDVFTTACPGEPDGMIVRTLRAMTRIRYPHTNYLCDEGNDPYLKRVCEELGVIHVTRSDKKHAKAGNINNALRQSSGEIVVVLDPDHEPAPYFLDRVLGQFDNPAVGFVQSVQAYRNQKDSLIARGAAEQSYHFYGPQMMGMHAHGTTQAIGANCVFRRAALDSIGGHAPGLAEDMHTSMRLYSKGWKSAYVPEILTRGLVPSTLAAFYKQQIKWSCGVFDLLFQEYPLLWKGFTWRQRLHFLLCPIFFLRGVTSLLEMLIPLACLVCGCIAWRATLPQIAFWFLPVLLFSAVIHVRVQRWLLEPGERGFHLAGGLLAIATWWVYLAGFLCALFRIKVPYIPTPKEGDGTNAWRLALPNLLVAAALASGAAYGVYFDFSPPSIFMAVISMANAVALVSISLAAQQLALRRLRRLLLRRLHMFTPALVPARFVSRCLGGMRDFIQGSVREGNIAIGLATLAILAAYLPIFPKPDDARAQALHATARQENRDCGGFYTGIDLGGHPIDVASNTTDPAADRSADTTEDPLPRRLTAISQQLNFKFRIVSMNQGWSDNSAFPAETLKQLRRTGATPYLHWLPADNRVDSSNGKPLLEAPILRAIRFGKYDGYLNDFAGQIRRFGEPVFICFAPQQDNPQMPWSQTSDGGNSAVDFAEAYKHIAVIFREQGASNVAWVWNPHAADAITSETPLELEYINWIAISPAGQDLSFSSQYQSFRSKILKWHLPVMVDSSGISSDAAGIHSLRSVMGSIATEYPEIKAAVFVPPTDANAAVALRDDLQAKPFLEGSANANADTAPLWFDLHPAREGSNLVQGEPGNFSLMVDGAPFYVKGVVYNAGHDWRDSALPLSRRQLDTDFSAIQAMGGNTIRRYGSNWSDRNIFNAAVDHHLKVMYGFWLPQDADYLHDEKAMNNCQAMIESTVKHYRNHPGLLGWSLGNEVWGLLKHQYAQPCLTQQRHAEVLFVERMTRRIKELDPNHPVFCAQESFDVSGAVADYATGAPSLDVMCVNSYYEQEIAHLDQAVTQIDPNRPYLVSEFGPDGYWDDKYNHRDAQEGLMEATAVFKGWQYGDRWREYVARNKGRNVGGIAYCWSDRYEGTATWFGMTDLEGRRKPACAALASAWNHPDPGLYGTFPYDGPRIVRVSYPTQPVQPNIPFHVGAEIQTCNGDKTAFIWSVTCPDFSSDDVTIKTSDIDGSASIRLPSRPGWYRIELKVTNRDGLDETSVPVKVESPANPVATN